jgi:hypothetical protein
MMIIMTLFLGRDSRDPGDPTISAWTKDCA